MKRASLLAAGAIVLTGNVFALVHAWKNRAGGVETSITLTERELPLSYNYNKKDDDSGVGLNLRWTDSQQRLYGESESAPWLNEKILRELGFDTSAAPGDERAFEFYARQRHRRAFVALEYEGPAWHKWLDDAERAAHAQSVTPVFPGPAERPQSWTHLMAIDAGSNAARLRSRHPDRSSVIIVPAVIRIEREGKSASAPARLFGAIQEIPSAIHVPLPFSEAFRRLTGDRRNDAKYRVHLRYGALLDPWVDHVE